MNIIINCSLSQFLLYMYSFAATINGSEDDMRFVYCACCISTMINDWRGINKHKAIDYILSSIVSKLIVINIFFWSKMRCYCSSSILTNWVFTVEYCLGLWWRYQPRSWIGITWLDTIKIYSIKIALRIQNFRYNIIIIL